MHHAEPHRSMSRAAPRRRLAAVVASAVALVLLGGLVAPVGAQEPDDEEPPRTEAEQAEADEIVEETLSLAPESPPSPDDPFAAVVETSARVDDAALARLEATTRSQAANARTLEAAAALNEARDDETEAVGVRDDAVEELAVERERLSDLTVRAYVTGGDIDIEQYRAVLEGDISDAAGGRELLFTQVLDRQKLVTEEAQRDLKAARSKLRAVRAVVAAAEQETATLMEVAAGLARTRIEAQRLHLEAIARADQAEAELRKAAGRGTVAVPEDVAIIGLPRLDAEDLAGWFQASPYRPRVATPIEDYARWFIEEGRAEGIRGDIAFAQAVLETGGFANNDSVNANNFSGIGHCDSCATGWTFPSPRLGVRAQIQLLKSYAIKQPTYVNDLVDRRLRGPAGCCDTWGDLTTVWATDPTYGPKVMFLYTAMVDHALARRARGEGFEPAAG